MVKFKPFDHSSWGKKEDDYRRIKINPVCLPESSFPDEDQVGFFGHLGLGYLQTCRTNGGGPEMYSQCAAGKLKERSPWCFYNCVKHRGEDRRQGYQVLQ